MIVIVAAWAITSGVAEIAFALSSPDTLAYPWHAALSGACSVLLGLLLSVWPRAGTLTWLLGIYAIIYGGSLLYYAYRLQALHGGMQSLTTGLRRISSAHEG